MAIIYDAVLTPSKHELLAAWVPEQAWFGLDAGGAAGTDASGADGTGLHMLGAFRFDDPAGHVGMETHLVRVGSGPVLQVPLSYRGAPLPGGEPWLAAVMEHSVLGRRWVYDACADPIYAAALAAVMLRGGTGADQFLDSDGTLTPLQATAAVQGSGSAVERRVPEITTAAPTLRGDVTIIEVGNLRLAVYRRPETAAGGGQATRPALTGTWNGGGAPLLLAEVL